MISYFVFETLPRFFAFIYRLILDSALFGVMRKAFRAVCRAFKGSFIGRVLGEKADDGKRAEGSLLFRVIDGAGRGIVSGVRKLVGALTFGSYSFFGTRLLAKLRELYTFLDFEFVLGVSLCFFILCPGQAWHNVYGLVLSIFLLVMELLLLAAGKRKYIALRVLGASFFAFIVSTLVSVISAGDKADAFRVMVFFGTSFIMTIVIAVAAQTKEKLKKILGFVYAAVLATAVYAIYQRVVGVAVDPVLTDLTANAGMPGRVFSTFENPNNYAEMLILFMPFCAAYCTMIGNKKTRFFAWIGCILPLGALLMTYSRSGWISFAIAAAVFLFFYNKKLLPIIVLIGIAAIPLLPSTILARIATIGSTKDSSNMYRVYIWEGVLNMLKSDFNWFTGVGLGPMSFRQIYLLHCNQIASPAPHSHMLYLEIWIEQGVVGILSYFGIVISAVRRSAIAAKYAGREVRAALIAGISAICGISFASAAEYVWFYPRVMVCFFIVLGFMYAGINITSSERSADTGLSGDL